MENINDYSKELEEVKDYIMDCYEDESYFKTHKEYILVPLFTNSLGTFIYYHDEKAGNGYFHVDKRGSCECILDDTPGFGVAKWVVILIPTAYDTNTDTDVQYLSSLFNNVIEGISDFIDRKRMELLLKQFTDKLDLKIHWEEYYG